MPQQRFLISLGIEVGEQYRGYVLGQEHVETRHARRRGRSIRWYTPQISAMLLSDILELIPMLKLVWVFARATKLTSSQRVLQFAPGFLSRHEIIKIWRHARNLDWFCCICPQFRHDDEQYSCGHRREGLHFSGPPSQVASRSISKLSDSPGFRNVPHEHYKTTTASHPAYATHVVVKASRKLARVKQRSKCIGTGKPERVRSTRSVHNITRATTLCFQHVWIHEAGFLTTRGLPMSKSLSLINFGTKSVGASGDG